MNTVDDAACFDRVPPQDREAEQAASGAMLLSPAAITDVRSTLTAGDWYWPAHATVFTAACDLADRREPVDPITLAAELDKAGELARIGGASYLHTLVQSVPTAANAEYYAERVRECAVRRHAIEAHTRAIQDLYAGEGDLDVLCDRHEADLHLAHRDARTRTPYQRLGKVVEKAIDDQQDGGKHSGVLTGFQDVDALTHGFQPGELIIVAARPAMGKSTLAMDFVRTVAVQQNIPSALFSLEMGDLEIGQRVLSAEAKVGLHNIRGYQLSEEDWQRIGRRLPDLLAAPMWVDTSANLTMAEIATRARELHSREGIEMLVVDYLQLLESGSRRRGNRQEEVSEISRRLKLLAKELGVPVIALSQLNRGPESREDNKPMVSDLRESGAIEQDADMVILLHRPDVYDKESERAGEADLIFGKCRNAPTCTITVGFQGHYSRFTDLGTYGADDTADYRNTLPRREDPAPAPQAPAVALPTPRRMSDTATPLTGAQAAVQRPVGGTADNGPVTAPTIEAPAAAEHPDHDDPDHGNDAPPTTPDEDVPHHQDAPVEPPTATPTAAPRTATPPPAPTTGGPTQQTPAERRAAQALALLETVIADALKTAKGDPEKAKLRLAKKAIPTVMDLFDGFRQGTRYQKGFVHQKTLDEFSPGGKDGMGGWNEVWEARPKFGDPYRYLEDDRVTRLDVPCAYLSAFKAWLPLQPLTSNEDRGVHPDDPAEYRPQGESKTRSGLYEIDYIDWEHAAIPHPLGNRQERGRMIVPHPVLMRLFDLSSDKQDRMCEAPRIHRTWTAHATENLLEDLRKFLRDQRAEAKATGDELRDFLIKQMYSKFVSTIGGSNSNNRRTRRDHLNILHSRAYMNLHMRAVKAHRGGLEIVHAGGTDELHVIGDPWRVFTQGSNPGNMKIKADDTGTEGTVDA
ncbi:MULTISPECIES: replicative DNA helicase [Actinomycetes]|uniref:replicative DNA helicase n=1 Tax=Actinomycetes TaxID=1760 RepID=UPI0021556082|nr:replicative DNA helicase [Streptomyces noursei]